METATRGAHEDGLANACAGEHVEDIGIFDAQVVVTPVRVAIGLAPAPVVDGDNPAGWRKASGECVEIVGGARQSGQADHGQGGRGLSPVAHMQL